MRYVPLIALLGLALAGCTEKQAPSTPLPGPQSQATSLDAMEKTLEFNVIDLYLHDMSPTAGVARKPTFWLHTNKGAQTGDTTWAFEDAYAVIYDKNRNEEEGKLVELWAKEGRFEEGKSAYLKGSVKAVLGAMTIELSDIEWQNPDKDKPGEAYSDNPVKVSDPQMQLQASKVRLYPDKKELKLTGVTGLVRFEREKT